LFIVVPILLQLSVFQPFFARFFPPQKPGSMIREVRKFGETPGQLAERIRSNTANAKVRHGEERVPLFSQKMAMTWMIFLSDVFYDIFWLDWKFWKFGLSCFFFFLRALFLGCQQDQLNLNTRMFLDVEQSGT